MYQFFVESGQISDRVVTITGKDVNHIRNVLRMKPGEIIRVSTQAGDNYFCEISQVEETYIQAEVQKEDIRLTELPSKIYLFQGIPKGDRMETVIEKAVELGVHEIIPVAMKHCVVRLDEKKAATKLKKWQQLSETSAKQSKRSLVPQIHPVMSYKEAVAYAAMCETRLVPYENALGMQATKAALDSITPGSSIAVFIGPEGGFDDEEISMIQNSMQVISLGSRILRTDTAGITVMSMLMMTLEMKL